MSDTDPSYERARAGIEAFTEDLYSDANPESGISPAYEETAPMFDALAQINERYEKSELIGRGGMKEIYRVYDLRASREVAMARPAPSLGRDDFDTFLREAHITARLDHQGIIKLFDMGIGDDERPFFTMEFKKGASLREMIHTAQEGKPFPLQRRLAIFQRVCEAIAYAHSQRVLHLDLKPENIQVGEFGEVQVCDWGMGVVMPTQQATASNSEVLLDPDLYGPLLVHSRGTPGYMAPEQLTARQAKTPDMDVYSLGCLLQELVTLQAPDQIADTTLITDPTLYAIVSRARNHSIDARYRSVRTLTQDISRYMTGYSTSVEDAGFFREALLFYRRNRNPCRLAVALATIIVVITAAFITQLHWRREEARAAQQAAERTQALYLEQKIEAKTTLKNYQAVRHESDRRLEQHANFTQKSASQLTNPPFINVASLHLAIARMQEALDLVISLNPPPESAAWHQKFWLLFLTQNFDEALAIQEKDMTHVKDLLPLAKEYATTAEQRRFLKPADFGRILAKLAKTEGFYGSRLPLVERMLIYDMKFPRKIEDRVAIVRDVLAAVNPQSRNVSLKFDPKQRAMSIKGSGIQLLSIPPSVGDSQLSLLRVIDPLKLSIRGSAVKNLNELKGLRLIQLDLRGVKIKSLLPLQDMRSLKHLQILPGQFTTEQLSVLPKWVEVIEM